MKEGLQACQRHHHQHKHQHHHHHHRHQHHNLHCKHHHHQCTNTTITTSTTVLVKLCNGIFSHISPLISQYESQTLCESLARSPLTKLFVPKLQRTQCPAAQAASKDTEPEAGFPGHAFSTSFHKREVGKGPTELLSSAKSNSLSGKMHSFEEPPC